MTDRRVCAAPKSKPNLRINASLLPLEVNGDAGANPAKQEARASARAHDFADVVLIREDQKQN